MSDGEAGVYVTGRLNPCVLEQERRKRNAVAPADRQHETGESYRDEQGNDWIGALDELSRRAGRRVLVARVAAVELATRLFALQPDSAARDAAGFDDVGTLAG